jgi:hypothetical protein
MWEVATYWRPPCLEKTVVAISPEFNELMEQLELPFSKPQRRHISVWRYLWCGVWILKLPTIAMTGFS